jgi:hypothetical protein
LGRVPYPEFISRFAVLRAPGFSMLLFFDTKLKTGALLTKLKDAVHCWLNSVRLLIAYQTESCCSLLVKSLWTNSKLLFIACQTQCCFFSHIPGS